MLLRTPGAGVLPRLVLGLWPLAAILPAGPPPAPAETAKAEPLLKDPQKLVEWLRGHNPDIAAAAARVEQGRADLGASRLFPNPALSFSVGGVTTGRTNPPGLDFGETSN